MRLLLLGTGGFHPSETRQTACFLMPDLGLLLDAGTAAFRVHDQIATERLDIYLSHAHLDHVVGLTYLLGLEYQGKPVETVVHAKKEVLATIQEHLLTPALFPISPVTQLVELAQQKTLPCGAKIHTFPLDHPGGSLGMRIEQSGKSIAYVSDTKPLTSAGIQAIEGVDLLIHEANFLDSQREMADLTGHSTAADAARAAVAAKAGCLVMVHSNPRTDETLEALAEAKTIFPHVEWGEDGQEIVI